MRGLRIIGETLIVEAAFVSAGFLLWVQVLDSGWGLVLLLLLAAVPAPLYAGWRSPQHSLWLGTVAGGAACMGIIAFVWVQAYLNPCPPQAFECSQFIGAYLGTGFALATVLPAFLIFTPLSGVLFGKLRLRGMRTRAAIAP